MKLKRVQCSGPAGQGVELVANGEGELAVDTHRDQGFILIRDTGLPAYPATDKIPSTPRVVAQFPLTGWAFILEWEVSHPSEFVPTNPTG